MIFDDRCRRFTVSAMQFDRNKLKSAVLHAIHHRESIQLSAVKLHKVLYYSDMLRYAQIGNAITGSTYKKRPFGPACEQLQSILTELAETGQIVIKTVDCFGYMSKDFLPVGDLQDQYLAEDEIALLDEVIRFVYHDGSATSIGDLRHGKPWESVGFGEEIRYNSVYHMFPAEVSPEAHDWASTQVNDVARTKSSTDPLDYVDFTSFRSKLLEAGRA